MAIKVVISKQMKKTKHHVTKLLTSIYKTFQYRNYLIAKQKITIRITHQNLQLSLKSLNTVYKNKQ
jgi:hypothetical protein